MKFSVLALGQRVADAQRAVVGDADHVAGERLLGQRAVAGEEELRRVQRDQLAGAHLLQPHAAHEPAGADAGEGDAVAMVRVHVRLDLEHQRGQVRLRRLAPRGLSAGWARGCGP